MGVGHFRAGSMAMLWIATPFAMFSVFIFTAFAGELLLEPLGLTSFVENLIPVEISVAVKLVLSFMPLFVMVVVTWAWVRGQGKPAKDS